MGNYKRGSGNYKSSYLRTVVKTTDQIVNNSTVVISDTQLKMSYKANKAYHIFLNMHFLGDATADLDHRFTHGSAIQAERGVIASTAQSTTLMSTERKDNAGGLTTERNAIYIGVFESDNENGILQLQWAQNVAVASDTTMKAGSYLMMAEGK